MGKAAKCIRMLQILNNCKPWKISDLAKKLDANPRMVIEYRKELIDAGYNIRSKTGINGGYYLDKANHIPTIKLTFEEMKGLSQGAGYLNSRNDFLYKEQFENAMAKVFSSMDIAKPEEEMLVINRFPLIMPRDELVARYNVLRECVLNETGGKVVRIEYLSQKNEVTVRNIHPYKLFMYNNAWFVLAFDEKSSEFRYFKINRIKTISKTDRSFKKQLAYKESDYLDEFGMKQNGEWYNIKLKITGRYAAIVQERIYGRNQTLECIDENTTILSCEMQNKADIISFILGFGTDCEILGPEWLKEELLSIHIKLSDRKHK